MIPPGGPPWSSIPELLLKPMFWFSALGSAAFRALTGEPRTLWKRVLSFTVAVFAAVVFTEPVAIRFGFQKDGIYAVTAIVALTGEHLMALLINLVSHPERTIELWNKFRGRAS